MNKKQIATLVRAYTGGSMNIEALRGPEKKFARVDLMKHLRTDPEYKGLDFTSIANLYGALHGLFDIDGTCAAHMQLKLIEALREALVCKEVTE